MNEKLNDLLSIINRHTENTFKSIDILFDFFSEKDFTEVINGFPVWQQFYHMLNSIDRIFIDPIDYEYPEFHKENMNNPEVQSETQLNKNTLLQYYLEIKRNVRKYLSSINEDELYLRSNHKTISMTKLDHILAQLRHIAWHLGYLHSCAKVKYGEKPEHILI